MNGMINFNVPPFTGKEMEYIKQAVDSQKICGDGEFTKKCNAWIEERTKTTKCLLTTSCTHAIELAALLAGIKEGDEVILPSYTFVSTADAFVLRGAKVVFVDVRPDTMNIDETKIEAAITQKTKAIVPVHYAGVACEMDTIMAIAKKYNLVVIEDAAQGIMSTYKGQALGTIGDYGCFSFHETKNYSMGEGGALLIRDASKIEEAEIIRGKELLADADKVEKLKKIIIASVNKYEARKASAEAVLISLQAKVQKGDILSNDDESNKFNAELYLSELDLDSNVRTNLITSKSNRDIEDILNMAKELIEMHKK